MRQWVFDPHSGGKTVPPQLQGRIRQRILNHAASHYAGKYTRLDVWFRGKFCYIDAYTEPDEPSPGLLKATGETREAHLERLRNAPTHLCRLRFLGNEEAWSLAFYTYSNEKYEPCTFDDGSFLGPPEAGFDVGAMYLT